jgi:hypothetical protein
MFYYEVGDMVIVKTQDLLRAGKVMKANKKYTEYTVRYIGGVAVKKCSFNELIDYDKGRELLERQIEAKPDLMQPLSKVLMMADL